MKKIIAALVVLAIAVPVLATNMTYRQISGSEIIVEYNATGDPCLVRAFGFDVTVDSGAQVIDTNDTSADYPIFPGSIVIDALGNVTSYGSPVGNPADHPDTQAGLGTGGATIEMGSLYDEGSAPGTSGDLLVIEVNVPAGNAPTYVVDCNVAMADNAARGGIVLEDGTAGSGYTGGKINFNTLNRAEYANWVTWGKPANWRGLCWKCGDVNQDGFITFSDTIAAFTYYDDGIADGKGDVNMDGFETYGDYTYAYDLYKANVGNCAGLVPCP